MTQSANYKQQEAGYSAGLFLSKRDTGETSK